MHSFVWSLDSKFAELDILWHSLRLLAGGIIISGPPCSLMVAASQSVHRRTWTNLMGNIQNKRVRLSNILWSNYAIWLRKASVTIHHIALRCNNSSLPILYNIMYIYIYPGHCWMLLYTATSAFYSGNLCLCVPAITEAFDHTQDVWNHQACFLDYYAVSQVVCLRVVQRPENSSSVILPTETSRSCRRELSSCNVVSFLYVVVSDACRECSVAQKTTPESQSGWTWMKHDETFFSEDCQISMQDPQRSDPSRGATGVILGV